LLRSLGATDSGATVNETTAMRTGVVYACVRILSESVALLPLRLHEQDGETTKIATGHPVDRLLRLQPNRWQSPFEYKRLVMSHMLLAGNHYSLIRRAKTKCCTFARSIVMVWWDFRSLPRQRKRSVFP
jgi:HK97 family phage portal protein